MITSNFQSSIETIRNKIRKTVARKLLIPYMVMRMYLSVPVLTNVTVLVVPSGDLQIIKNNKLRKLLTKGSRQSQGCRDRVCLLLGYCLLLSLSPQEFLLLILLSSERWKSESTLESPICFESRSLRLKIQCLNK